MGILLLEGEAAVIGRYVEESATLAIGVLLRWRGVQRRGSLVVGQRVKPRAGPISHLARDCSGRVFRALVMGHASAPFDARSRCCYGLHLDCTALYSLLSSIDKSELAT